MPLQRPRILCSDYNHDDDLVITVLRNFIFIYYIMVKRETPTECYKTWSTYTYRICCSSFVVYRGSVQRCDLMHYLFSCDLIKPLSKCVPGTIFLLRCIGVGPLRLSDSTNLDCVDFFDYYK